MNIENRTDIAWEAMSNAQDYDAGLTDYAKAAAKSLGWIAIADEAPDFEDVVVCTDGTARWLDTRTPYSPDLKWNGHTPTHWHPLADLSELSPQEMIWCSALKP